ncbi:MAG: 16S rRNA (cytidine(1402)-2'-O)-methyltransferase [Lachnospiraceae bacterium]|nr:16S rRNA (cytidine(1402)-2'-O)-methyltransferase [Lachnospiraceae bacterium]
MLYLCATPIGNLGDITLRVLETLKTVDLIAAEDTRHTIHLLNHFEIKTPMTSYHEYNKYEKADILVKKMQQGAKVALVTDAGTPGISDPGEELVKRSIAAGVRVTSLPGPAACITALTMSGLSTRRFAFEAFLTADKKERKQILEEMKRETRTMILYEAPHHLKNTVEELLNALGDRTVTVCRELTKIHESAEMWKLSSYLEFLGENEPRGEYVLVIEGKPVEELRKEEIQKWEELSVEEHMAYYESEGYTQKEAMKLVAKDRGVSKREIYQQMKV